MAAEVAQYLQNQFLTSLEEAESELSGSVNLLSYFEAIKDILKEEREVISFPMGGAVESLLCYLSQLNYALVECRNVANKCKELNKKLLLFNKPFLVYFILSMKRRLTTLKHNFRKYYKDVKSLREREWETETEREWKREWESEREREGVREREREMAREGVREMEMATAWAREGVRERERERAWAREGGVRAREAWEAWAAWARAAEMKAARVSAAWRAEAARLRVDVAWKAEATRMRVAAWEEEVEEAAWAEATRMRVAAWVESAEAARAEARAMAREWEKSGLHVFGFDEKAKKIEEMLFGSEGGIGFSAIGIVGIGGAGKTTLVRKVWNTKRVWYEFSPIILLCLSDIIKEEEEFTRAVSIRIVTSILEQSGYAYDDIDEEEEEGIRLGKLLKRLYQRLLGKKYLIVLDDVWHMNDFYSDLAEANGGGHTLGDRLSHGLPKDSGGAVMVTTRITKVARGMVGDQNNLILVDQLDRETCWRIFMDSIPDQYLTDPTRETLEKIKNEIQDQFLGLPLAAKTLAEFIPEKISRIQN